VAAHNVSKDKALAAEITRPVAGGDVTFNLGISRRLENGAPAVVWIVCVNWRELLCAHGNSVSSFVLRLSSARACPPQRLVRPQPQQQHTNAPACLAALPVRRPPAHTTHHNGQVRC
jgi:hypothetical protein